MSQGRFFREFLHSSSIYAVGLIVQRAVSFLLLPLYTRYLTPADYGILELLDLAILLFAFIAGGRMASSLIYFYKRADSDPARKEVLSTGILGCFLVGLTGAAIGALFAGPITSLVFNGSTIYAPYLRIMLITFAFNLPLECCLSWLRAENRAGRYVRFTFVQLFLMATINIILVAGYQIGFSAITWSAMIGTTVLSIWQSISVLRYAGVGFNLGLFREMLIFAAPIGLVALSAFVFHVADRLFLQSSVSLAEIGIYALAYKLGMLISFLQTSFNQHWTARQFDLQGNEDSHLYTRLFTYLMVVMVSATFAVWVFTKPVIQLLTTAPYWAAAQYVPWILLAYLIRAAADYFRSVFYIRALPRVDAILNVGCVIPCLAAYWWLIPQYQLWGAVYATLISFSLLAIGSYVWGRTVYPIRLEWVRLGKLVVCAALLLLLFENIVVEKIWAQLILALSFTLVYPATLLLVGFLTPEEHRVIQEQLVSIGLRSASALPPSTSVD